MAQFLEASYDPEEGFTLQFRPCRLMPDSTRGHLVAANKELLLALRSVLDDVIARTEERERQPRGPRKVEVKSENASAGENAGQG